jgi:hypothetical protein
MAICAVISGFKTDVAAMYRHFINNKSPGVPVLNHRSIAFASLFVSFNLLLGCQQEAPPQTAGKQAVATPATQLQHVASPQSDGVAMGTVLTTLDAAGYTYVQADVGGEQIWLAGPSATLTSGGEVDVSNRVPMHNFHSKALNRDFAVLYFVDSFSGSAVTSVAAAPVKDWSFGDQTQNGGGAQVNSSAYSTPPESQPLEKVAGGYDIAEIIANKKELVGKVVKVRGKVTKFTGGIMRKNWIHLSDGSGDNDLIAITDQLAAMGQTVVVEGTVSIDRDFGYGYFYELLIEDSKVTVEN